MIKISAAIIVAIFCVLTSCKKRFDIPAEEVVTKFSPPTWKADETGKYPASMTAVVAIPSKLYTNFNANDQLAAFAGDECRGEGVIVKLDTSNVFFVLIRGISSEHSKITFKYYSAKTSYMYETLPELSFLVDDVYGTAQNPKVLDLKLIK